MKFTTETLTATRLSTVLAVIIVLALTPSAEAQAYNIVHNFTGGSDGANPIAGVTLDAAGSLYGTASAAGRRGFGTVYRLVHSGPNWLFYLVYTFEGLTQNSTDGSAPYSRVVIGPDGFLYGTTHSGGDGQGCKALHGCGTVYTVRPKPGNIWVPWEETVLYQFGTDDGSNPDYGDLVFDQAGNLYGTTRNGGAYLQGTVYELTPNGVNGTERVLHSFAGLSDGATPLSGAIFDQAGNLYGSTSAGGTNGSGTAYQLKPSGSGWTENALHSFQNASDGGAPTGGVILDSSGDLYGATQAGGMFGNGTVFELTSLANGSWSLSALYAFVGAGIGGSYRTITMDNAGNLYGTSSEGGAHGWGSVFKLTWSNGGWVYRSLHDFTGGADGGTPFGSVVLDASGNLYGTTFFGGTGQCNAQGYAGCGVVFEITP
jgi:uncharacterized repeat protein (TIGR03803 family)